MGSNRPNNPGRRRPTSGGTNKGNQDPRLISRSARQDLENRKSSRKKAKKRARVRRILTSFIILILLIAGIASYIVYSVVSKVSTNGTGLPKAIVPSGNEPFNILVLGMDIGDAENANNKAARRTDTMMVVNYNPSTKKVNIVSVPRDTLIEVNAHDESGNIIPYWKINAAYALGGEEEVITHVEKLLDTKINYLMEVDYAAFRSIIDAIGGIDMEIDRDMYYDDDGQNLHINFKKGETVHLDGAKAEQFFRWRKNNDGTGLEEGDIGRIQNQHKFISKIIAKVTNPSIIFKVPEILKVIESNVSTNIAGNKLVSYGLKFARNSGVEMHTLKGTDQHLYNQDFLVVDPKDNMDIINAIKSGTGSSSSSNSNSVDKSKYKILVQNGTNVNGLAGEYKTKMANVGYNLVDVGNSQKKSKSIILSNDKELKEQLKSDTGISNFGKKDGSDYEHYDAVIILGEDYSNTTLGH